MTGDGISYPEARPLEKSRGPEARPLEKSRGFCLNPKLNKKK